MVHFCRGVGGNVEMENSPRADIHSHENVQDPESRRNGDEEVASDNSLCVILNKDLPALIGHAIGSVHIEISRNSSRRDSNPKLQRQFIGDPFFTPRWVILAHLVAQTPT